jgi:predicted dehydrogenase
MPKKIWRGGMIGAGAWSEVQLQAWAGVENAEIIALTDRHPERRDRLLRRFAIKHAFDDIETMLDEVELDFVDICVRPYSHAHLTQLAAGRGLPVLCQKPFCESLEEAREVVKFCEHASVRLMINENWRWQAWYRKAKELMGYDAIGKPFLGKIFQRIRSTLPNGFVDHPQAYFAEMPRLALYELGVHYLDTLRYLFGDPGTVFARLHRVSPYIQGEDVELVVLGYDGLTCLIDNSWASVQVPGIDIPEGARHEELLSRLEIDGTEGTLALKADGSLHLLTDKEHQQWRFSRQDTIPASHIAAQQHFIECLKTGAEFETSGLETLKTMVLVYAAYLSAEEGRVVKPCELLKEGNTYRRGL